MLFPERDESRPLSRFPVVLVLIIAANIVVFLMELAMGDSFILRYSMKPAEIVRGEHLETLFTSMFMHANLLHIFGNMLYLWVFGRGVESALGFGRYLALYLASGVVAALTQVFMNPTGDVPMIGASGAIAGVLGAYLILKPRGNVVVLVWIFIFVRLVSLPAVFLLGLWFLLQLASGLSTAPGEPGVAFWAHVGWFVAGICLVVVASRNAIDAAQANALLLCGPPSRSATTLRQKWRLGWTLGVMGRSSWSQDWNDLRAMTETGSRWRATTGADRVLEFPWREVYAARS